MNAHNYSWCIYEIPGHKVGMCKAFNYPVRPRKQLNKLLKKTKLSRSNDGEYKLLAELHDITQTEAMGIEQEWQDKLGYVSDIDKRWVIAQSEETKAKMSAVHKGKIISEYQKQRTSATHKGKITSEETKAKMSAAHKGKVFTKEHKAKLDAARVGRPVSAETREKISTSLKLTLQNKNK